MSAGTSRLTFHLIPHTHWDLEWYLTRAEFQARLVPVLDDVLTRLEQDPDARFLLDGQTILLEDYLAIRPEQEDRIRHQVRRGALEIGPWYVLADLLIPSANSLRRNLEQGHRDAKRFGGRLEVLYSPDAFGHPAALPAIAAEFGLRRAVVRRGLGGSVDFHRWVAPGGESLLVHHLSPGGYDLAIGLARAGQNLATEWAPVRSELVARATVSQIPVFLGADHHALVGDAAGLRDRLQALEPGHTVRISGLGEFFAAAEAEILDPPTLTGALRRGRGHTWDLQDVHSSRARLKRAHSVAELRLARLAEPLARQNGSADDPILGEAWRRLLASQFHDTLAGSTCDAAQIEQRSRLDAVNALSRVVATGALAALAPGAGLTLWNPAGRERECVVTAPVTVFRRDVLVGPPDGRRPRSSPGFRPFALREPGGVVLPVQVLAVRQEHERRDNPRQYPDQDEVDRAWIAFRCPSLPPEGAVRLEPVPKTPAPGPSLIGGAGMLRNPQVEVHASRDGTLRVRNPASGLTLDGLLDLDDQPDRGDLYTFSPGGPAATGAATPIHQAIRVDGPLVGAIDTGWSVRFPAGRVEARSLVALYQDSPLVRIRLDLSNRAKDHRLRIRFLVGPGRVIAGATIGIDRLAQPASGYQGRIVERAVATAPGQRFAAGITDRGILAVFAPGFFEYEWTPQGQLLVTAFRAIGELSRGDLPERPGHAAWPTPTPDAQELDAHRIELALALLSPEPEGLAARLEALWEDAFLPIQAIYRRDGGFAALSAPY